MLLTHLLKNGGKMHNHEKPKACKHELKHCDHCDVVYCEKCKKEWGQDKPMFDKLKELERRYRDPLPYTTPYTKPIPVKEWEVTCGPNSKQFSGQTPHYISSTDSVCNHN